MTRTGSVTELSTFEPAAHVGGYGLGVYNPANGYAEGFGHTGQLPGYMSWAACLPEDGAVIVVLTNHEVDDGHLAFSHGLGRPLVNSFDQTDRRSTATPGMAAATSTGHMSPFRGFRSL